MNRSPTRHQFSTKIYCKKLEENPDDENAKLMVAMYDENMEHDKILDNDLAWCTDNLEYDLRSTDWIIEKVKSDRTYAQYLYAAICNNDFTKNDVWPILTEKKWSCSWRHSGSIIADMLEEGDYMDWYCSGIQSDPVDDDQFQNFTKEQQENYLQHRSHVSEGIVTDEIREDLFKLGWLVISNSEE